MSLYDNLADTAAHLLDRFGVSATLKRHVRSTFDPVSGKESVGAFDSYPVVAVVLPASKSTIEAFDNRVNLDGSALNIERYRFVILAAQALEIEPQGGDVFVHEGNDWHILGSTPVAPGGTSLIYRMGVRKI